MSLIRRIGVFVLAPVLAFILPHHVAAQSTSAVAEASGDNPNLPVHERAWVRVIRTDLINEKFDDLDSMADQYRREKTRMSGGEWRLRVFYSALDAPQQTDQDSMDHIAHLEQWVKLRPQSITARVALATSLHRWAWVARGKGYANTVTAEGWQLFNERIQRAYTVLQDAANFTPMCPQWYSEIMTVGLAQSWDAGRVKENFERGVQLEPGYYYLYLQYANYLLPKWDGHPGDAAAFAKSSADSLFGDAGDVLYFQIATVLIKRGDGDFPTHQMDWERIQRGYQSLTAQYGGDVRTKNQLAYIAWKFRDAATARRQFALIGDDWSHGVWGNRSVFDRARDWSQATQLSER
jgi:hypothetical protein